MLNPIVWLNYAWKIPNKQAFWPFLKHFYVVAKISWSLKLCFNKSFDTYDIFEFMFTVCRFGSVVKYWVHYLGWDGSSHPKFYFNLDKFRNSKKNLGLARTITPQILNPILNHWAKSAHCKCKVKYIICIKWLVETKLQWSADFCNNIKML